VQAKAHDSNDFSKKVVLFLYQRIKKYFNSLKKELNEIYIYLVNINLYLFFWE
jgi:hypothetical protein